MTDLRELLERVEKATGPSSELDKDIAVALVGWCLHQNKTFGGYNDDTGFSCPDCGADSWGNVGATKQRLHSLPPPVTGSADAVSLLVEQLRPGWAYGFDKGSKTVVGFVDPHDFADRFTGARYTAEAETACLAILAALLRSLIAEQEPQP